MDSLDGSSFNSWDNANSTKPCLAEGLFVNVSCTYCQEDINGVRIQCCECEDFDMCLQCFSNGAEIGPHKNDHSYRFIDHYAVSIFNGKGSWSSREELQLLDAIETYGFGNWENISQHMKTRTAEEVKEKYISRYLEGNIGKATWGAVKDCRPVLNDHIPDDRGPLSPEITSHLPPLDCTPEEASQLGYLPHRDDYEREYNMDAEKLVSSLHLNIKEDSNIDLALKLAQVDMYTRCLRERFRRKRLVKDYQLAAKYFGNQRKDAVKKQLTEEQKEFREKMRVFSQFLTSGEHERLINSIEKERELRHRLSELLRYRSLGLTTQDDIIHYEQHAAFERQEELKNQNQAGSSGYNATSIPEVSLKNGKSEESHIFTERKCTLPLKEEPEPNCLENDNSSNNNNMDNIESPSITLLPQGSLLSQSEAQLCTKLNIMPVQYTTLKSIIIQDNLMNSDENRKECNSSSISTKESSSVKDVITEYLRVSGWLPGVSVI